MKNILVTGIVSLLIAGSAFAQDPAPVDIDATDATEDVVDVAKERQPAVSEDYTKAPSAQSVVSDDYVIGVDDVLQVSVWKEDGVSVPQISVRPDGMITVPLVKDIKASGKTPRQLQEEIAEKLQDWIKFPNVTVIVLKALSRTVTLIGEVGSPGIKALSAPTTVLDMLAMAGGLNPTAKVKNILIVREEDGKTKTFKFNYKDVIKGKNLEQNILLREGDTIMVP